MAKAKSTSCKAGKEKNSKGRCVKSCAAGEKRNSSGKCSEEKRKTRADKGKKRGTRKARVASPIAARISESAPAMAPLFGGPESSLTPAAAPVMHAFKTASFKGVPEIKKRKTRKDKGVKHAKIAAFSVPAASSVHTPASIHAPSHHTPAMVTAIRGKLDSHGDLKASTPAMGLRDSDSVTATPKYGWFGKHLNKGERRRRDKKVKTPVNKTSSPFIFPM
jgi:hypothetical protein